MKQSKKRKKKVSNALTQMNKIRKTLRTIGMDRQTPRILKRNAEIRKLIPPKTRRGKEASIVETYKKDDAGLSTIVHVPFNAETRDFKRTGKGWILVTDALPVIDGPRYYKEPIICSGRNFAEKICLHAKAVEWCLRHRPVSQVTGKLMVPYRNPDGEYLFVARDEANEIVDSQGFFAGLPYDGELVRYVNKFIDRKKGMVKRRKKLNAKPISTITKSHTVAGVKPTGKTRAQGSAKQLSLLKEADGK